MGAVLNKATAQDEYAYYGGYQPYVMTPDAGPDGGASQHGHGGQNGFHLPPGQPGRHYR